MALAIGTTHMAKQMSWQQRMLDQGGVRRYQVQRLCVYATVVEGRIPEDTRGWRAKQEALDWQADPDDVQDDVEVLHHLKQQAATVPLLSQFVSGGDGMEPATTLVASVHSSSFAANTRGRLLPSFHRGSIRWSDLQNIQEGSCIIMKIPSMPNGNWLPTLPELESRYKNNANWHQFVVREFTRALTGSISPSYVFLQFQADVVDLCSWRSPPTSRPAKRRRAAVNPFLQVSDPPVVRAKSRGDRLPHDKRFNGVRYRLKQDRWEAMMKPRTFDNKQYFGSFKVEAQAARAVDAAFHHYSRPDLLNFPDSSPQLLATRPSAGAELDKRAKLEFVKDEAKWLASVATDLPLLALPSNSRPAAIPQPSTASSICPSARFRSFSEISWPVRDCGDDEADDAVSQPGQWMQLDPLGHVASSGLQSEQPIPGGLSSVQITEQDWVGQEGCSEAAVPMVGNFTACEMQSFWEDSVLRSPPASVYPLPSSPRHFEEEMALALLEQQS